MKLTSIIINTSIALQLVLMPLSAYAASIDYSPTLDNSNATISGRIPLNKLGSIAITRGKAYFNGNTVDITTIPEWQFDKRIVLNGTILRATSINNGMEATIKGIIYFQDGEWMTYIDNSKISDEIDTKDGTITGRIVAIDPDKIEVDTDDGSKKVIAVADITNVYSPRAYRFTMPAMSTAAVSSGAPFQGEAQQLTLNPTQRIFRLAALKKDPSLATDGDESGKHLFAIWALLTAMQTAQFIPEIALPLRTGHIARVEQEKIFQTLTSPAPTPTTVAPLAF